MVRNAQHYFVPTCIVFERDPESQAAAPCFCQKPNILKMGFLKSVSHSIKPYRLELIVTNGFEGEEALWNLREAKKFY